MNKFFVCVEGYDINGGRHETPMTIIAKELDGEKLCAEYAEKNNYTDVSIVRSRNLGPIQLENLEGEEDEEMSKKITTKKKVTKKTKK